MKIGAIRYKETASMEELLVFVSKFAMAAKVMFFCRI